MPPMHRIAGEHEIRPYDCDGWHCFIEHHGVMTWHPVLGSQFSIFNFQFLGKRVDLFQRGAQVGG